MAIYAAPGATFEATLDASTGLSPTVAIYDTPAGTTEYGPSATGVTEFPAGSGLYAVSLTAPDDVGSYSVVWTAAGTYAREDLVVTPSGTPVLVSTGSDLTTLANVKTFLGITDTSQDGVLQDLITRASAAINRRYCEFSPQVTEARDFRYRGLGVLNLGRFAARSVTSVVVDPLASSPSTLTVNTDYSLAPVRQDGVYRSLYLPQYQAPTMVRVTAAWGYGEIPADVEHACILTVANWRSQTAGAFRSSFIADMEGTGEENTNPVASFAGGIPAAARRILAPYRRIGIG